MNVMIAWPAPSSAKVTTPPTRAPTMPMSTVRMMPIRCRPGTSRCATAPITNPMISQVMMVRNVMAAFPFEGLPPDYPQQTGLFRQNPGTLHGPFGGQRRHGVRPRYTRVEAGAGLGGPVLGREVDVDDAEPLLVAPRPLEVVQQRPYEVPGQVGAVVDRAGGCVQVLVQVLDPLQVVHDAVGAEVVLGTAAVLRDVQRQARGVFRYPQQQLVQALGVDEPAHVGVL